MSLSDRIDQRINFKEKTRQNNIERVIENTATQLDDTEILKNELNVDWKSRFFDYVQDVSSEEMQLLWAKVLAGEVKRVGSVSIRTLGILKDLDQDTALLFQKFCSCCLFLGLDGKMLIDARVPSLGRSAGTNSLAPYGLNFSALNLLNEYGLIISDYNSWHDYRICIGHRVENPPLLMKVPFGFQGRNWILNAANEGDIGKEFRLSGVALTNAGRELSSVVGLKSVDDFSQELTKYFLGRNCRMTEVSSCQPMHFPISP